MNCFVYWKYNENKILRTFWGLGPNQFKKIIYILAFIDWLRCEVLIKKYVYNDNVFVFEWDHFEKKGGGGSNMLQK